MLFCYMSMLHERLKYDTKLLFSCLLALNVTVFKTVNVNLTVQMGKSDVL